MSWEALGALPPGSWTGDVVGEAQLGLVLQKAVHWVLALAVQTGALLSPDPTVQGGGASARMVLADAQPRC